MKRSPLIILTAVTSLATAGVLAQQAPPDSPDAPPRRDMQRPPPPFAAGRPGFDGPRDFGRREGPGHGLHGVELATLTPRLGSYFGVKAGVLVVHSAVPALKLEDGDVITSIDGRDPTSAAQATRILRSYREGEKLGLKVLRDRKPLTLDVTIAATRQGS